ncbi:MAG: calcium-binding protein [Solirubrobacterales bacterium]
MTALALVFGFALPASGAAAAPAQGPSCAEGPQRSGGAIVGTPCDDYIVAPGAVTAVYGGGGNDTIVGSVTTLATGSCETGCHLEVGSQTFEGGPGNDIVYGDRGNDTLRGNGGDDRLYGGIGDDVLEGGPGNDLLSGGFGADKIDGGEGDDYVRGDGTIDHIFDSGGGYDTLSFSTGITPGFGATSNPTGAANFPGAEGERGVWLKLGEGGENANDGIAAGGGGVDEVQPGVFERIIGTPFSDYIVGSSSGEAIYGGGGADVIKGEGGDDVLNGGADGDYLDGGAGTNTIEADAADNCVNPRPAGCGSAAAVQPRETTKASVGETTAAPGAGLFPGATQVYVVGSSGSDTITATYGAGSVSVSLSAGTFNDDAGGCALSESKASATCPLPARLDSLLLAGMNGNDTLAANGFPDGVGVVEIGGNGEDHLTGGASEDVLVDGNGASADTLSAGPGDDALIHNDGADSLDGGEGSDLFLSVALCRGEVINGGAERAGDRDNSSWARLGPEGVEARIDTGRVGRVGAGGEPECPGNQFDTMTGIEDLEGSNQNDVLIGDARNNQLLGHKGQDTYYALAGQDSILANSGTRDLVINCGADLDQAIIDFASVGDPTPVECESVREGAPDEFRELELLSPPPVAPLPPPDRKPPRTKITKRPAKLLTTTRRHRRVVFRFTSSERGSSFRCKLDRKPYRACSSPRVYNLGLGRHAVRIDAIDAAGNADRTPALLRFQIRQVRRR